MIYITTYPLTQRINPMRKLLPTTAAVAAALCLAGCLKTTMQADVSETSDSAAASYGAFTDERDGQTYRTVAMGADTWMAENLNYRADSSWCYENDTSNCNKYGRLYRWEAAKTACPAGWHLPSRDEWDDLAYTAGGEISRQRRPGMVGEINWFGAGTKLKSKSGWVSYNASCDEDAEKICEKDGNGTDDYGFSALPGGYCAPRDGRFHEIGSVSRWWTDAVGDIRNVGSAYNRIIYESGDKMIERDNNDTYGFSVRCVRNGGKPSGLTGWRKEEAEELRKEKERIEKLSDYFTDSRDGRTYRTVKIGGKAWMAENLNYETPDSSWCRDSDTSLCNEYGRLYDWETALTVCPNGWHLPTRREWNDLVAAAGGADSAAKVLKARIGWDDDYNLRANGTDDYGFSALAGGGRFEGGRFSPDGISGLWWTATQYSRDANGDYFYGWSNMDTQPDSAYAYRQDMYFVGHSVSDRREEKIYGNSVRCVQNEDDAAEEKKKNEYEQIKAKSRKDAERKRIELTRRQKENEQKQTEEEKRLEKISDHVTDSRDGQKYRVVKIGSKRWTARNLNYRSDSSWCYENDTSNCNKYGRLYIWEAAKTACPAGWHLPSHTEWNDLALAVDAKTVFGCVNWYIADKKFKTTVGWIDHRGNRHGNGTDEYKFSALPSGSRDINGKFHDIGKAGSWWTITETDKDYARFQGMSFYDEGCGGPLPDLNKKLGLSVRCIEDE